MPTASAFHGYCALMQSFPHVNGTFVLLPPNILYPSLPLYAILSNYAHITACFSMYQNVDEKNKQLRIGCILNGWNTRINDEHGFEGSSVHHGKLGCTLCLTWLYACVLSLKSTKVWCVRFAFLGGTWKQLHSCSANKAKHQRSPGP